jgi:mono/diheme cytochrome c family protein
VSALIIGLVLVVLSAGLVFLAARAWRSRRPLVRWPAVIVAGALAIVVALVGVVDLVGVYRLSGPRGDPVPDVKLAASEGQVARGEHLANLCASCHSTTGGLPLDGGRSSLISSPDGSGLGTLYAPNLTPGGVLATWSDAEIIRAIREGIDRNDHALILMPSDKFHAMSDADVQAVVTYLRSQPAVARTTPPRDIDLIGTLLIGAGLFPTAAQAPITQPVAAPPAGTTSAYGRYLVTISGCQSCHGEDFAGGRTGAGPPPGPNLTLIVPRWSEDDFVKTIRTGSDPNGYNLRPEMPWRQFSAAFSDDELKAIYADLRGLTPIQAPPR